MSLEGSVFRAPCRHRFDFNHNNKGRFERDDQAERASYHGGDAVTQTVDDGFEGTSRPAALGEWQAAWKPTVAAALGWAAGGVLLTNVSSVFLRPIIEETGWTTSQALLAPIVSGLYAIMSPFAGRAVDRFGPKRVAAAGQVGLILTILVFVFCPLS